jgi:hypothetical protein
MEIIMAEIQQNGSAVTGNYYSGTSTKNNSGSMIAGGTNPNRNLVKNSPKGYNVGVFASVVVQSDLVGNAKAVSAGTFSHNHVKPLSARITTELAGVNNNAILRGADVPSLVRSINKLESVVTNRTATAFRAGFNLFTGRYVGSVTTATDNLGSDVAANPTRSNPGRLVFMLGKKVPTLTSYKAKTN